jgi:hypothetical protein
MTTFKLGHANPCPLKQKHRRELGSVPQTAALILGGITLHKRFYEKVIKVKADVAALLYV